MFGLGFDKHEVADGVKRPRFGSGDPALLGFASLGADDLVKDMLPGARGEQRVGMAEINPGQLQIHGPQPVGLIQSNNYSGGLGLVFGFEAFDSFGDLIEGIVNALATEEQAITQFHAHALCRLT